MKKLMLSIFALAAVVLSANAQANTATESATGKVEFITPITLSNVNDQTLDFGKIAIGTGLGSVSMTATANGVVGVPTVTGSAQLVASTRTYAMFLVGGQNSIGYTITLPSNVALSGTTPGVEISTFNTPDLTLSVDATPFYVGGVLEYPANTVAGNYTGDFNVIVAYN